LIEEKKINEIGSEYCINISPVEANFERNRLAYLINFKMKSITLTNAHFGELKGKTIIVTGAAAGIGAATARVYHSHGANVVLADLEEMRSSAETVVACLSEPARATFIPVNIVDWGEMTMLFRSTKEKFGSVDVVVANAGIMESSSVLESQEVDENGELKEPTEAYRVIDTNLKGTLNSK
jgi:NAD(P)-dependent dehydrogenase (short-subunit alcohol dehydrogenase family)